MICEHLAPILDHELSKGNTVTGCETGWSAIKLAIHLERPMDTSFYEEYVRHVPCLEIWENSDSHYSCQKGIICSKCRQSIAAPLPDNSDRK
jgi:hypothetical protein